MRHVGTRVIVAEIVLMKISIFKNLAAFAAAVCVLGSTYLSASNEDMMRREETMVATMTATVAEIDHDARSLTLESELGEIVSLQASDEVERFDEIEKGDMVSAEYVISIAAELREPTAEELENPLVVEGAGGRAPGTAAPAGAVAGQIRVIATIEGLDRPTRTVTIKGPAGRYSVVGVQDVSNLPKMRIGDHVVITYTEALAVSLEKVASPKG